MPKHWPEYEHEGERWVVEAFDKLVTLFPGLTQDNLAAIHALGVSRPDFEAAWGMVQRLCGIRPAILEADADASRLHPMSMQRVATIYQIPEDEVEVTVSLLRAAWEALIADQDMPKAERPAPAQKVDKSEAAKNDRLEFTMEQLQLLELGTYPTTIFDYHRNVHDRYIELEWFAERIKEVRKVFEEPMAKALARMALLNELQLRRLNDKLVSMDPEDREFVRLQNIKRDIETAYQQQWQQVEEICPAAMASQTRKFSINHLSDIIKAYQQYKSDPDNRARDGVFTDDELQILFRTSIQEPNIRYRFGWVTAVNQAKLGINDPKWKRKLSIDHCKLMDASFAFASKKMIEALNMSQPDLESTGPDGEYPPIHLAPDGEITDADLDSVLAEQASSNAEQVMPTEQTTNENATPETPLEPANTD